MVNCFKKKGVCHDITCENCKPRRFCFHLKAKYWSKKNIIDITQISNGCNEKYWFNCDICPHDFNTRISKITDIKLSSWCPYCAHKQLCNNENCDWCNPLSFKFHEKAKYWSDKNELKPWQVFMNSGKKFWFNCNICPHDFESSLNHIFYKKWCPHCCDPPQKLCECNNCYIKTIGYYLDYVTNVKWSESNLIKSNLVFRGCNSSKYNFICCTCNKEFLSTPNSISRGSCCPYCKNKTEKKLFDILKLKFPDEEIKLHVTFDWLGRYVFDIQVDKQRIIELDGYLHFVNIPKWNSLEENVRKRDVLKMKLAMNNKMLVIRLLQEDVWYNRNNWEKRLYEEMYKERDDFEPVYICDGNLTIYDKHKEDMKE